MHFLISPHHNLKKGRGKQQGISSFSLTWRILSRQQSRKTHCSLQSAISVAYFVLSLAQAGERKGEQKCICTGLTLFFPPSASPEWVWSRAWPAGAALHLPLQAWAGTCAWRWSALAHQDQSNSLLCQGPLSRSTYSEWSWYPSITAFFWLPCPPSLTLFFPPRIAMTHASSVAASIYIGEKLGSNLNHD